MKLLRQAMRVTMSALTVGALCAHLLIAGLGTAAPPFESDPSPATSVARIAQSPPRDMLVARSHTASLSLHQNERRTDSLAATLASPPACPALAQSPTQAFYPPAAGSSASLLPAASRAPPSLVA